MLYNHKFYYPIHETWPAGSILRHGNPIQAPKTNFVTLFFVPFWSRPTCVK